VVRVPYYNAESRGFETLPSDIYLFENFLAADSSGCLLCHSLVAGRIGLHEGLGDTSYSYAAGLTATTAPPESGWGAPGAVSPHERKRTRRAVERPPARRGAVRRTTRAEPSPVGLATRPTFAPPEAP